MNPCKQDSNRGRSHSRPPRTRVENQNVHMPQTKVLTETQEKEDIDIADKSHTPINDLNKIPLFSPPHKNTKPIP